MLAALRGQQLTEEGWIDRPRSRDPPNQSELGSVSGPYPDRFVSSA
jgi:hypothetical protein